MLALRVPRPIVRGTVQTHGKKMVFAPKSSHSKYKTSDKGWIQQKEKAQGNSEMIMNYNGHSTPPALLGYTHILSC